MHSTCTGTGTWRLRTGTGTGTWRLGTGTCTGTWTTGTGTGTGTCLLSTWYKTAKCTKVDFGWGSAPDHAGGAYSAPPDPVAVFKGAYFWGEERGGKGRERGGKGEGKGLGMREEGRERDSSPLPPMRNPGYATALCVLCQRSLTHLVLWRRRARHSQ